ncbi:unnamed protein product [Sphagnum troendelagicum]|uniref:PGG domain-containing protein n=1 Tax=Sphagnum troendelagicum TaxID=128251 RepID=A0ABP0TAY3_9BRYO
MMAQNNSEDKEISDFDSHETKTSSESVEVISAGGTEDSWESYLKPKLKRVTDEFNQDTMGEGEANEAMCEGVLTSLGLRYDKALESARLIHATRMEAERIENFFVDKVVNDCKNYAKGLQPWGRKECWAASHNLVNIVVALIRRSGADDPRSPSSGLRALAIAAEDGNDNMIQTLTSFAGVDEDFQIEDLNESKHPDSSSPNVFSDHRDLVYALYPGQEVWLSPIEAAARLGYVNTVHQKAYGGYQTPLTLAVLSGRFEIVKVLCEARKGALRTDVQTEKGKTAIEMAFKKFRYRSRVTRVSNISVTQRQARNDIWKYIMERADSRTELNRLTEERKVHVDAINAILVGTALIATATFAGWLSPPLGYSSPPGTDGPFASVEGHPILESFWVFNSLSFFFSIATFMVGANVALPPPEHIYVGDVVQSLRWKLKLAYGLVSAAVFFVMGAFASAGFAVLPPIPKYTVNMELTVGIGVTVVAVVVFLTFFGHMFITGWQELQYQMNKVELFRAWQQSKHKNKFHDD